MFVNVSKAVRLAHGILVLVHPCSSYLPLWEGVLITPQLFRIKNCFAPRFQSFLKGGPRTLADQGAVTTYFSLMRFHCVKFSWCNFSSYVQMALGFALVGLWPAMTFVLVEKAIATPPNPWQMCSLYFKMPLARDYPRVQKHWQIAKTEKVLLAKGLFGENCRHSSWNSKKLSVLLRSLKHHVKTIWS